MGTSQMKKRITLQKQFVITFVAIYLLSLVSSFLMIMLAGEWIEQNESVLAYQKININKITAYLRRYGSSIIEQKNFDQIKRVIGKEALFFYLLDSNRKMIYNSKKPRGALEQLREMMVEDDLHHVAIVYLPIVDERTGRTAGTLVLVRSSEIKEDREFLAEWVFPFICFGFFTLLLAGRLSRKLKKPLQELLDAIHKIKNRDLDFTIKNTADNEIGDLARALEDMRRELNQSLIREWQLELDRRDMVAALTHDLRTPLAIIQGHVEGLQEGLKKDPAKLERYLQTIEQNTARVKNLIDEMNALAEVDSVDFSLNLSPVDLEKFLGDKVEALRVLAAKKEIDVTADITDRRLERDTVMLDFNRLAQIFENITGNSLRFTPGGGTIGIIVNIEEGRADFRICDSGPGFAEKDLPHLFKKFYKGDYSRSLEKGHSGMGLYIARRIVEQYGGGIAASNLPEGGACIEFWIQFPV